MKGATASDLRKLSEKELEEKLSEMRNALLSEKKSTKTRPLRKAIARILTIKKEKKNKKIEVKKVG
jgi:ribosomal protein L29